LLSGKHVLVEKPFCTNAAHARELVMIAASHKLVCVPYQNRRFDSDFRTLSKLIREGRLGDIVEYNGYFNRWSPAVRSVWKDTVAGAGGNFLSLGSHMIDQAVSLFGAPSKIWADVRCQRSGGILDDAFEVHLFYDCFHLSADGHIHTSIARSTAGEHSIDKSVSEEFGGVHKGGFRAILKGSLLCRDHRVRYMIHGTHGSWTKRGVDVQEAYLGSGERLTTYLTPAVLEGTVPLPESHPREPREIWGEFTSVDGSVTITEPEIASYQMVYDSLYESIVHQKPSFVAGNTAITVVRLLELAYESSRTGQVLHFSD
jgi:predicted dehydrogenase